MDRLIGIKNSFIDYLSPPGKRRRTLNPSTPDGREHTFVVAFSDPQDKKAQAAAISRLNNHFTPVTKNTRKRAREEDEESITFSPNSANLDPDDSISQIAPNDDDEESKSSGITPVKRVEESIEPSSEEEVEDDVEMEMEVPQISAEDKVTDYLARQAELEQRLKQVEVFKATGNHADEVFLFERLSMRGFEQLLPAAWQMDFPTLPIDIFTEDAEKAFINNNCISSSRAVKALQSLLTLGVRVRDNIATGAPTERLIAKEIRSYIRWAERDGGFEKLRFIPVLTVVKAQAGQDVDSIGAELTCQMKFLAAKHRNHLAILPNGRINELGEVEMYTRQPPLLYGIVVVQTFAIFFTLDSADPEAKPRNLTHVQFSDKKMDAWNEFAVALTVIVARNSIMSIKDELEADEADDPDPDA